MQIVRVIKQGNRIAGYEVQTDNRLSIESKENVIKYINSGKITNAKIQIYKGQTIIRIKDTNNKPIKDNKPNKQRQNTPTVSNTIADSIVANIIESSNRGEKSGADAIHTLLTLPPGTPLKTKIGKYGSWKQCIYLGADNIEDKNNLKFLFFDGYGVTGTYGFSASYLNNNLNKVEFKFDDNNPEEVSFLLNYIKKGPFNAEDVKFRYNKKSQNNGTKQEKYNPNTFKEVKNKLPGYYYYAYVDLKNPDRTELVCSYRADNLEQAIELAKDRLQNRLAISNNIKIREFTKVNFNKFRELPSGKLLDDGFGNTKFYNHVYYSKIKITHNLIKIESTVYISIVE